MNNASKGLTGFVIQTKIEDAKEVVEKIILQNLSKVIVEEISDLKGVKIEAENRVCIIESPKAIVVLMRGKLLTNSLLGIYNFMDNHDEESNAMHFELNPSSKEYSLSFCDQGSNMSIEDFYRYDRKEGFKIEGNNRLKVDAKQFEDFYKDVFLPHLTSVSGFGFLQNETFKVVHFRALGEKNTKSDYDLKIQFAEHFLEAVTTEISPFSNPETYSEMKYVMEAIIQRGFSIPIFDEGYFELLNWKDSLLSKHANEAFLNITENSRLVEILRAFVLQDEVNRRKSIKSNNRKRNAPDRMRLTENRGNQSSKVVRFAIVIVTVILFIIFLAKFIVA